MVRRGGQRRAGRRRHDHLFVGRRREGAKPHRRMGAEPEAADRALPFEMGAAKYDGTTPMVNEYTIERRDGKTVLRLVSSGIPDAPEWDGFYNGTDSGWRSFLRTLRHYLEHHGGRPRTTIKVIGKLSGSPEDAWARLVAAVKPTGTIVFEQAPTILEVNIPELGDAYLCALDVVRRSEQLRLYHAVGLRKDAGRGRNDPREMAAVARAGAGRRGAQRGLTAADQETSDSDYTRDQPNALPVFASSSAAPPSLLPVPPFSLVAAETCRWTR